MIVRSGSGFRVKSEHGKNLSRVLPSRAAAERRLAQVEFFKHYGNPHHSHPFSLDPGRPGKCLICGQPIGAHKIR